MSTICQAEIFGGMLSRRVKQDPNEAVFYVRITGRLLFAETSTACEHQQIPVDVFRACSSSSGDGSQVPIPWSNQSIDTLK
ncbi:unnamed protein product [Calypogeia fissa]